MWNGPVTAGPAHDDVNCCTSIAESNADGDDVFQEAILRAAAKLGTLRDPAVRSWMYSVVVSVHRSRCRRAFWTRFLPRDRDTPEPVGDDGSRWADDREREPRHHRPRATAGRAARASSCSRLPTYSIEDSPDPEDLGVVGQVSPGARTRTTPHVLRLPRPFPPHHPRRCLAEPSPWSEDLAALDERSRHQLRSISATRAMLASRTAKPEKLHVRSHRPSSALAALILLAWSPSPRRSRTPSIASSSPSTPTSPPTSSRPTSRPSSTRRTSTARSPPTRTAPATSASPSAPTIRPRRSQASKSSAAARPAARSRRSSRCS